MVGTQLYQPFCGSREAQGINEYNLRLYKMMNYIFLSVLINELI